VKLSVVSLLALSSLSIVYSQSGTKTAQMNAIAFDCQKKECVVQIDFSSGKLPDYAKSLSLSGKDLTITFSNLETSFENGHYSISRKAEKDSLHVDVFNVPHKTKKLRAVSFKLPKTWLSPISESFKNSQYKIVIPTQNKAEKGHWSVTAKNLLKPKEVVVAEAKPTTLNDFYSEVNESSSQGKKVFMLEGKGRAVLVVAKTATLYDKIENGRELSVLNFGDSLLATQRKGDFYEVNLLGGKKGFVSTKSVKFLSDLNKDQNDRLKKLVEKQTLAIKNKDQNPMLNIRENQPKDTLNDQAKALIKKSKEQVTYSSYGRRDPFIPLPEPEVNGVSIDEVQLVGIIWENRRPMAIVEDVRNPGVSYTLKENDPILNGRVLKITPQEVIFELNEFGISRKYSMALPIEKQ
jgi:hypothetical protein